MRTFVVAPSGFAEVNLKVTKGENVYVRYEANGELSWNRHSHQGSRTTIHETGNASTGKLSFSPDSSGLFSYLWENTGSADVEISITVQVDESTSIHSWHPQ